MSCINTITAVLYMLFAVRIASSAQAFRGFAIQARESTPSFSSAADFVGEFVNPPPGANWEIWNCGAVRLCSTIIITFIPWGPGVTPCRSTHANGKWQGIILGGGIISVMQFYHSNES